MKKILGFALFTGIGMSAWGHARLVFPTPRDNNSGIKTGPCGGLARSFSPTLVRGGQTLRVTWEETVNHPGKFLFSLSMNNDQFDGPPLQTVVDSQGAESALPHRYTAEINIPNVDCDTCTLQLIQSMEEVPTSPRYYYSCADLKIIATSAPPPAAPGDNTAFGNSSASPPPQARLGGGCGTIGATGGSSGRSASFFFCLLIPCGIAVWMRGSALRLQKIRAFRPRPKV